MRWRMFSAYSLIASCAFLQAGEAIKSGPQVGELLPGPLRPVAPLNINGKHAGRHHCLVCENELNPVVMVFAREAGEGKDELDDFMKKLDGLVAKHAKAHLAACVIVLSPAAHNSATNSKEEDTEKLIEETAAREALLEKLKPRAKELNNVVLAVSPKEGPTGYKIDAKAETTVIFYNRLKVLANSAYGPGQFQSKDADAVVAQVEAALSAKKPAKKTSKKRTPAAG